MFVSAIQNSDCWSAYTLFPLTRLIKGRRPGDVFSLTRPKARQQDKHLTTSIYRMPGASTPSSLCLSVKSSASATLTTLSPCSKPYCAYCQSSLSLVDTPEMLPCLKVTSTPTSPSVQAILATMEVFVPKPPADHESSPLITKMMAAARTKAGWAPGGPELTPVSCSLPAKQLDFADHVEGSIAKSSALIAKAKAQLAATCVAPTEPMKEEEQEAHRNRIWKVQYKKKNEAIDRAMERNKALFEDVMDTIDDMEEQRIPLPDCDDLLTWESNAGFVGTPAKTPSRWQGMNVRNLVAQFNANQ